MRAAVIAIVLGLVASPGTAQTVDTATIARIRAEATDRSAALELYRTLTHRFGPRLTASPAYFASAQWARERLRTWGLADARLEPFPFGPGWTLESLRLEMVRPWYFPLVGYPEAWTRGTDGPLQAAPIYIGDRDEVGLQALSLAGSIVLPVPPQDEFLRADRPQPTDSEDSVRIGAPPTLRSVGAVPARDLRRLLEEKKPGVILQPNQGEHGTLFVLGRLSARDGPTTLVLASEHYNLITRLVQDSIPVELSIDVRVRYHDADTSGYNVLAEIPGTDPALRAEVVMVGAHLDSWHSSTGATDNADGVAAVMEAARVLTAVGARPRRTIRFALWGGEEQGLLGSNAWIERHAGENANERVVLYLNDDPGAGATYGFYMEHDGAAKDLFDAWLAPLTDLGFRRNVPQSIGSTDHVGFRRAGVPGFTTLKDYADYDVRTHHTNTDFYERVNEEDLRQSAIILAVTAWHAAHLDRPLPPIAR